MNYFCIMKVDYIIVGLGLAGLAFTHELKKHNKTFIVFEDESQNASKVAGGMYNPVILKRFTPVWDAKNQLEIALPFYKEIETVLNNKYDFPIDTHRLFTSVEEQNNWFATCDNPVLSPYMVPEVHKKTYEGLESPFGYGKLQNTGRITTKQLLDDYRAYLLENDKLIYDTFDYGNIQLVNNSVKYQNIKAKYIVFCEGFGIKRNPFFKDLPLREAKGELITIYAPKLKIDFVLKSALFIMPLGDDLFKVGATFNWKDKTNQPTEEGKQELLTKLNKLIKVPFEVVDHVAGIRPTVKDRRPLVGIHAQFTQLAVLNGLGTRGVMIAPIVAKELYNHIENNTELRKEIDIERFVL